MIDPGSATTGLPVKELTGALEKLGIFDKIKEKLFQQPDRAAAKLQSVFAELSRVLNVVDTELTTFGAVTFDKKMSAQDLNREKRRLHRLTGSALLNEVADGKSACGKIRNIYKRNLRGWFSRVLNRKQSDDLRDTFSMLGNSDNDMMNGLEDLIRWLSRRAKVLEKLITEKKWAEANRFVENAKREAEPLRRKIEKYRAKLRAYEREVIDKAMLS
jgi:hypothetical protein